MYMICFYVPKEDAEKVKEALFKIGAGKFQSYECCAFQFEGIGQFKPLEGSNPYIGEKGQIEKVPEVKVEMGCSDELINLAIQTLKDAHPYEVPAFYTLHF